MTDSGSRSNSEDKASDEEGASALSEAINRTDVEAWREAKNEVVDTVLSHRFVKPPTGMYVVIVVLTAYFSATIGGQVLLANAGLPQAGYAEVMRGFGYVVLIPLMCVFSFVTGFSVPEDQMKEYLLYVTTGVTVVLTWYFGVLTDFRLGEWSRSVLQSAGLSEPYAGYVVLSFLIVHTGVATGILCIGLSAIAIVSRITLPYLEEMRQ